MIVEKNYNVITDIVSGKIEKDVFIFTKLGSLNTTDLNAFTSEGLEELIETLTQIKGYLDE